MFVAGWPVDGVALHEAGLVNFFDRVPAEFKPVIEYARSLLPEKVSALIAPRFLCGVSPHFVGLHHHEIAELGATYRLPAEHSYDTLAHACYRAITPDEVQTIVFPKLATYSDPVATVLHEYGHMLDEATGFSFTAPRSTTYSRTNRQEAFAEAFEIILRPQSGEWREWTYGESTRAMRDLIGAS